ncbi:hypothetical protein G7Y89_g11559 [Cudoniella acicularis]|uniref:squalene synthase n=1 Tax=Cudoniella acicularis TaxID=354080 RepID=A0A8H4RAL5_9HELO|nr:hypothetical protein G7Y89_g11559 [Cudoniella acicularis]
MGILGQVLYLAVHPNQLRSIIQWKMWHELAYTRDPSKESATLKDCFKWLKMTSRSFATVVQELNPDLVVPVVLYYLVLRGLDTIEDDMTISLEEKEPLLRNFETILEKDGWTYDKNGPNEKDRELLVHFDDVITEFKLIDPKYRDTIKDITHKMGNGMADYASNAEHNINSVNTIKEYELYCHYVAGLVGDGLTRFFVEGGFVNPALSNRPELAESMGQFLQKTNIIRDVREDFDDKRRFWPKEIWSKHVDKFDDLFDPKHREAALACSSEMVLNSLRHTEECLFYMAGIKEQGVFNFVAIPQAMAIATLELVFQNPQIFETNVKITKGDAAQLMIESSQNLRTYCGKVEQFIESIYPSQDPKVLAQLAKGGGSGVVVTDNAKAIDDQAKSDVFYLLFAVLGTLFFISAIIAGARFDVALEELTKGNIFPNKEKILDTQQATTEPNKPTDPLSHGPWWDIKDGCFVSATMTARTGKERIAIVGAGPAGLTAGVLLHKHGVSFTIFELRHKPTSKELAQPIGVLDLHEETGLAAIKRCDLFNDFISLTGDCAEIMKIADQDGNVVFATSFNGESRPEISRHDLSQLLMSRIPAETIKWGHKLLSATSSTKSSHSEIQLDFGAHNKQTFDLVIGADGAWSRVRKLLTDVKPQYAERQIITLTIRQFTTRYPHLAELVGPGTFCALGNRHAVTAQQGSHDSARMYIFITTPDEDFATTSGLRNETALGAKNKLLSNSALLGLWGARTKELVTVACDEESIDHPGVNVDTRAVYELPIGHIWEHNPGTTLIGDAAHLMSPNGEGVNLGMWDAVMLSQATIKAYETAPQDAASFQNVLNPLMKEFEVEMVSGAKNAAEQGAKAKSTIVDNFRMAEAKDQVKYDRSPERVSRNVTEHSKSEVSQVSSETTAKVCNESGPHQNPFPSLDLSSR